MRFQTALFRVDSLRSSRSISDGRGRFNAWSAKPHFLFVCFVVVVVFAPFRLS